MNIVIREATENDAAALIAHIERMSEERDALIVLSPGEFRIPLEEQQRILAGYAASENSVYLVAEAGSELLGHLSCKGGDRQTTRHTATISMAVGAAWRNRGVGKGLMQAATAWGRANSVVRRLELAVIAENTTALELYRRFGFVIEGRRRRAIHRNGRDYDDLLMALSVDEPLPTDPIDQAAPSVAPGAGPLEPLVPIYTAPLFGPLNRELVRLLRGLADADWERPTVAAAWRVRDVAAHLLDGDLRKVSAYRDGHQAPSLHPIRNYADLVAYINDLNAEGVAAAARLSTRVIVDLLEMSGLWVEELVASLSPHDSSLHSVAWAGEDRSENWMDIGREYTERWHHQMQIRNAVGASELTTTQWMEPLLDLSVRALPRAYAQIEATEGTAVVLEITGEGGGAWSLVRETGIWRLWRNSAANPTTTIRLDADTAWRIFYNAMRPDEAQRRLTVSGDPALAARLTDTRSVMV